MMQILYSLFNQQQLHIVYKNSHVRKQFGWQSRVMDAKEQRGGKRQGSVFMNDQ